MNRWKKQEKQILENIWSKGENMLHILLLSLKIIGIVLAVSLGLLLLIVSLVLFVPLRYKGKAQKTDNVFTGMAKVT